jgi:hypothetical protein
LSVIVAVSFNVTAPPLARTPAVLVAVVTDRRGAVQGQCAASTGEDAGGSPS